MSAVAEASCKQAPGQFVPVINLGRCEGKGECVSICPEQVFELRRIDPTDFGRLGALQKIKLRIHGMKVAYSPNAQACLACAQCITACPEEAITLARSHHPS
jgi:NAD-dependent dihydropyrimidine dehydrogenase PreA subunit